MEAVGVLPTIPAKGEWSDWSGADSATSKPGAGPHHPGGQRFRQ